ncbi:hypothetical protein HKD37_19G054619 [Glycine soja]
MGTTISPGGTCLRGQSRLWSWRDRGREERGMGCRNCQLRDSRAIIDGERNSSLIMICRQGFASGLVNLGEIQVSKVTSGKPLHGFVLVAKICSPQNADTIPPLKNPLDFKLVWSHNAASMEIPGVYFWLPEPPEGYKALGYLVTNKHDKPLLDEMCCVRADLTDKCEPYRQTLATGSRIPEFSFQVWSLRTCDRGMLGKGVSIGTFFCSNGWTMGEELLPVACLKNLNLVLPAMPDSQQIHALIKHYGPTVPQLAVAASHPSLLSPPIPPAPKAGLPTKDYLKFSKPGRRVNNLLFASASDDGGAANESPQASTSTEIETMRAKLNSSLVDVDFYDGLLQSLYDAARVSELATKEHNSSLRLYWFSKAWLGHRINTVHPYSGQYSKQTALDSVVTDGGYDRMVTAVGHAAMLAAIKRYVPALLIVAFCRLEMKVRVVCRKIYDYIRYDLKEIAFPSSLPDPPHIKKRRKLTWDQRIWVLKRAARLYAASWVRDIGPDLRPDDYKKDGDMTDETNGEKKTTIGKEPSTLEDLAVAARGGMETLRPALQRVYMTRASAYRDALKSFIEGYQEGVQQVMEKKEDSKPQEDADLPKKST